MRRLFQPFFHYQRQVLLGILALVAALGLVAWGWMVRYSHAIHQLRRGVGDTVFYDARGRPWFRLDEHRRDVPLAEIPPQLRHAVLAIEDHRFRHHPGIDPIALARAAWINLRTGQAAQGGSTITQQLARTLFLSNRRTWGRKAKEAVLAVLLEQQLTKDQILELYLNRVYLSGGIYGVESMSEKLFGKRARELSLAEAALIAGLIRAPSNLSPWSNPERALGRSRIVLLRMRQEGFITPDAERAALQARPRVLPHPRTSEAPGGYAKEYLRQQFRERFGDDNPPDWKVHTTFSRELQDAAEQAIRRGLDRLGNPRLQAALVAVDPRTGDLLALAGGRDYAASQYNRAVRSRRQPGSAFKPFVYAGALERGYTPVSVLSGLSTIEPAGPEEWTPRNANGATPDAVTLREGLLESNNRAAVMLQRRVSSGPLLRLASGLGMRELPDVPSLALGAGLVSPLELTLAYAAFPNGGYAVRPRAIARVVEDGGSVALDQQPERTRVLSRETAFQMVSMLLDVLDRGTGAAARALGVGFPAGGKTGTTNDFKDAWFVGFSSEVVAGVWVGLDQPEPIGRDAYGARIALPVWADFMRQAARVRRPRPFEKPETLREEPLCRISYLQPVEECPVYTEYFKEGDGVPHRLCPLHRGTLKQRVQRAAEGFFRRLKGLFGR